MIITNCDGLASAPCFNYTSLQLLRTFCSSFSTMAFLHKFVCMYKQWYQQRIASVFKSENVHIVISRYIIGWTEIVLYIMMNKSGQTTESSLLSFRYFKAWIWYWNKESFRPIKTFFMSLCQCANSFFFRYLDIER